MNKYIKKIVSTVAAATVCLSSFNIALANESFLIHENVTEQKIVNSILHKNIQKFTSEGWVNINALYVDLDDKYTDIGTLFNENGISSRDTISNMIEKSGAIAGINGDFFSNNHFPQTLGATVVDGDLVVSPVDYERKLPVFAVNVDKLPFIDYWQWNISITPEDSEPIKVYSINRDSSDFAGITMFNKYWGDKTLGNKYFTDMVEIIIEDGEVTEIREGQEPTDMPEDGYILVGRSYAKTQLLNNFNIGDEVNLDIDTSPNFGYLKSAVGGGTYLVKDGRITPFSLNIEGNHPRTAIGISKDKEELILVTVDGRHKSFKGVTQDTLAQIMLELGAYDAINMDGGGSTTMAVTPKDRENPIILNHPSDGNERKVINGIGIFNDAPQKPLHHIQIIAEDKNVFVNTSRKFHIKGFDKYDNPVPVKLNRVDFSIKGVDGTFDDNILIPKKVGPATIVAEYKGKETEIDINVLDSIKSIQLNTDKINIDTDKEEPLNELFGTIYGENDQGYITKLNIEDIRWEITGDIGKIKDGIFYSSNNPASGAITAYAGDAVENVLVSTGYKEDLIESFESLSDLNFKAYPSEVKGSIDKDKKDKIGRYSLQLNYDFRNTDKTRAAYIMLDEENNGIELKDHPDKLGLWVYGNNSNHWLRGKIIDRDGNSHYIDFAKRLDWKGWKWVTADISQHLKAPLKLERIYLVEINPLNKNKDHILLDGLKALYHTPYKTLVLPIETQVADKNMRHEDLKENGYTFSVSKGVEKLDNLLKYQISDQIAENINSSDIGILANNMNDRFKQNIDSNLIQLDNGFDNFEYKNTTFIKLDNSNGGLRATNPKQWLWLKDILDKATNKNIILLMPKPVFGNKGFTDDLEAKLFHDILHKHTDKGKNIWVIHCGSQNKTTLKDGIRYISVDNSMIQNNTDISKLEYYKFTVNQDDITYELLPLWN